MKSRRFQKLLICALAAALCVYGSLYLYRSHRYASGFADTRLGDSPETVTHRFGDAPNTEFPHSGYFTGFTMFPCTQPCEHRLWWQEPNGMFRKQAYYFDFDVNRQLIRKTHYEHLDEAFLRWAERMQRFSAAGAKVPLFPSQAELFRSARVVVLVRLLEPPQVDPRDSSLGPLSKFLVVRSWKGPFPAHAAIDAATAALCYGPDCPPFPKQLGQWVLMFSLGDVQPIYPIIYARGGDEAQVQKAAAEIDAIATLGAQRDSDGGRLGESPAPSPQSRH